MKNAAMIFQGQLPYVYEVKTKLKNATHVYVTTSVVAAPDIAVYLNADKPFKPKNLCIICSLKNPAKYITIDIPLPYNGYLEIL